MDFIFETVSSFLSNLASGVAPACSFVFFEAEVPNSLREE